MSGGVTLVASAEFYDFAPAACVCLSCCNSSLQQGRTFLRIWDNRMEINFPFTPFGPFTCNESCVVDMVSSVYFDRSPFRSGMACFCCPVTCCGPPVIFLKKPMLGCLDMSDYCGQQIYAAPCNFFGLRTGCCFGEPCYLSLALPITGGVKNGDAFMSKMKSAVDAYAQKHGLSSSQMATFDIIGSSEPQVEQVK